jgi:pyruvate dehydrogenase E2 component (dihydrolipoamide acetyltransferase)
MRRAIAAAMAKSKKEIPHYYLAATIDVSRALDWLESENAEKSFKDRVLYNVLLLKAVAVALRDAPELNATWENERLNLKEKINVGTAISLRQGGLIAPATFTTDGQTLDELMKNLRDLVRRTRAGELRSSELSDSTITVTNLGEQGVETIFGVIYLPQIALVGFGKIYEGISVSNGSIKASRLINATLAADHRASDGHRGALFLAAIDKLLQEPEKL